MFRNLSIGNYSNNQAFRRCIVFYRWRRRVSNGLATFRLDRLKKLPRVKNESVRLPKRKEGTPRRRCREEKSIISPIAFRWSIGLTLRDAATDD